MNFSSLVLKFEILRNFELTSNERALLPANTVAYANSLLLLKYFIWLVWQSLHHPAPLSEHNSLIIKMYSHYLYEK
jgi:hypothetical protein